MSDSQTPLKAEPLPCPFSHLFLALIALTPAVITVPPNLNIVLTAATAVWVGSKRSVKDTPPEESMTRTVRACYQRPPAAVLHSFNTKLSSTSHLARFQSSATHFQAVLPVCQDALKFPLVGSAVLFGLFITFKILPKHLVNLVLAGYFALLGVLALTATLLPFIEHICSARVNKLSYTAPKLNVPSWLSKVHTSSRDDSTNIIM